MIETYNFVVWEIVRFAQQVKTSEKELLILCGDLVLFQVE